MNKSSYFSWLAIDLRSLAFGRFVLGLILTADLIFRGLNSFDFYTDVGIIPRAPMLLDIANPQFFSIFFAVGKPYYVYLLFLIGLFFYLCFTFGYKTRFSNIIVWIFFVSLSARTPVVSHGGDDLARLALFWMIFLPTGRFFSIDSALQKIESPSSSIDTPTTLLNFASLALIGQLITMYFFTAYLKWHPIWHTEGTAIYYALELDQFLTSFGFLFRQLPLSVLKALTFATLALEFILPLLILIPFKNSQLRWMAIMSFTAFHLGLYSVFNLGNFPWICIAYWMVFIPTHFWEKRELNLKPIQINYDPECSLCRKMCFILQEVLFIQNIKIQPAQNNELESVKKYNSWVITSENKTSVQYEAFIQILDNSIFKPLSIIFSNKISKLIGHKIYLTVSNQRIRYLKWLNGLSYRPAWNWDFKFWIQIPVLFAFLIGFYWNMALLKTDDSYKIPNWMYTAGSILRLHQNWVMFAPFPAMEDGWVIVEGQLKNGKTWDTWNNIPVSFEKPKDFSIYFKNSLWRKYLINLRMNEYEKYRLYFGRYLCRYWNDNHEGDEVVDNFKIYYIQEKSQPPGQPTQPLIHEMLWSHGCFL